jgi:hypothetical protein
MQGKILKENDFVVVNCGMYRVMFPSDCHFYPPSSRPDRSKTNVQRLHDDQVLIISFPLIQDLLWWCSLEIFL